MVGWTWRNCRSVGLHASFWVWPWAFGRHREEDVYGGERWIYLGPISFGIAYSIGNASSYGLDRFTALHESEAYERAAKRSGGA